VTKGSVQVISVILQDTQSLDSEIVLKSLSIIKKIENTNPAAFSQLKKDSSYKNNMGLLLSGVMKFT